MEGEECVIAESSDNYALPLRECFFGAVIDLKLNLSISKCSGGNRLRWRGLAALPGLFGFNICAAVAELSQLS
jgi:hypothetical protein